MTARLTTAISIGDAANALLQTVKRLDKKAFWMQEDWSEHVHIGVEPMLLALSMELALKAWYVFDHDTPKAPRSHNLSELFSALKLESRERLEAEFKRAVAPFHPSAFFLDDSIENVLHQHANAFTEWRYLHEPKNKMFDESVFVATLEMVIREFRKRYRIEKVPPFTPLG